MKSGRSSSPLPPDFVLDMNGGFLVHHVNAHKRRPRALILSETQEEVTAPPMVDAEDTKRPRDFVRPVVHVMNVLRSFGADSPQMSLSQVARKTGMDRAAARRYLLSLAHLGYIVQTGRLFRLTPKVLDLGFSFISSMSIADIAQNYLSVLSQRTDETFGLAILDGQDVVHIAHAVPRSKIVTVVIRIGERLPALTASGGRVLLAFQSPEEVGRYIDQVVLPPTAWRNVTTKVRLRAELGRVRRRGYALNDPELDVGLRALSVPILNPRESAVAALVVVTSMSSVSRTQLTTEFLPLMRQAAAEIRSAIMAS
jgi:IclR family transcriptional regulator, pca regulon regulatory protein